MLRFSLIVGATLAWALPNNLPRAEPPDPDFASKVDEWASQRHPAQELVDAMKNYQFFGLTGETPTLEDYAQPNEYLTTVLSPGDSYTAGIGSNKRSDHYADSGWFCDKQCGRYSQAWPEQLRDLEGWRDLQGDGYRRNNFGACSGGTIQDIIDKQLQLGENRDEDQYKKIGTPQIAVLTAGGNDFQFGDVIKVCVLGIFGTSKCEATLKGIEDSLQGAKREEAKAKYRQLISSVIVAGRLAKGANPPESFQVYMGTYIPFFGVEDSVCDQFSWNTWGNNIKLNKDFRTRLNNMVEAVNAVIEEAVKEMEEWGVYLVNGYQRAFDGHRFCDAVPHTFEKWDEKYDNAYHSSEYQDYGSQTWFWSWKGDWDPYYPDRPDLGYDHPIWKQYGGPLDEDPGWAENARSESSANLIMETLIPDADQRAKVEKGEADPGDFSDAFKDDESLEAAVKEIQLIHPEVEGWFTDDSWYRIWHPKGNAHYEMAKGFFETIKSQRKWDFHSQEQQPPAPAPTPAPIPEIPQKHNTLVIGLSTSWECRNGFQGLPICSKYGNQWFFFTTNIGEQPTDLCSDSLSNLIWDDKRWGGQSEFDNPPWPGGDYPLSLDMGNFVYKSDGSTEHGSGALFDANGERVGDCAGDLTQKDPLAKFCRDSSPFFKRRRVVSCDF